MSLMATTDTASTVADSSITLFEQIDSYPWDADEEFQSGLRAILGPNPAPEQAEQLTLRARCFYYARKLNAQIDFAAYRDWHVQQTLSTPITNGTFQNPSPSSTKASIVSTDLAPTSTAPTAPDGEAALYPLSFNHIVELITSGQPIPGIKDVPDIVLEGQASQTMKAKRKKPWEKSLGDEGAPNKGTGHPSPAAV